MLTISDGARLFLSVYSVVISLFHSFLFRQLGGAHVWLAGSFGFPLLLAGCGVSQYPGQPGVLTDKHSKLDIETLAGDGLYTYEASYDNRLNGPGMGAIVTKYYPGALTYTSSVRTNADGSLYRVKGAYKGARVEMISLPQQNQILLPPESTVLLFAEYELSVDEVDAQNLAEADLFTPSWRKLSRIAKQAAEMKLAWLKAGNSATEPRCNTVWPRSEWEAPSMCPRQTFWSRVRLRRMAFRCNPNANRFWSL
ncbi:MAG: hypothetical protein R3B54_03170 [Bdellovibrionota bacterium]